MNENPKKPSKKASKQTRKNNPHAADRRLMARPAGVTYRDDGNPRWEVRIRWMVDGERRSLPVVHYPVDLEVTDESDRTHKDRAEEIALDYAKKKWQEVKENKVEWTSAVYKYTLKDVLERFIQETENGLIVTQKKFDEMLAKGIPQRKNAIVRSSFRREVISARIFLGRTSKGYNTAGFPDICAIPVKELKFKTFFDLHDTNAFNWRMRDLKGNRAGNSTIKSVLSTLRSIFNHAINYWGLNFTNPLSTLKAVKVGDGRSRILSSEEMQDFITDMENSRTHKTTIAAILFIRQTGCRRSEACDLKWEDINFKRSEITFVDTKSNDIEKNQRTIPASPNTMELLKGILGDRDPITTTGSVFVLRNKALRHDTVTQAWVRTRKALFAKTGDRTYLTARIHDLRHTRITELGQHMTIAEVSVISGHKDIASFSRYFNATAESVAPKLNKIDEIPDKTKALEILSLLDGNDLQHLIRLLAAEKLSKVPIDK